MPSSRKSWLKAGARAGHSMPWNWSRSCHCFVCVISHVLSLSVLESARVDLMACELKGDALKKETEMLKEAAVVAAGHWEEGTRVSFPRPQGGGQVMPTCWFLRHVLVRTRAELLHDDEEVCGEKQGASSRVAPNSRPHNKIYGLGFGV